MPTIRAEVTAARRGDRRAFERLVRAYGRAVHQITLRVLRDDDAAEDAAQEAFVAAWRGLAGLRDPERFGGWLLGIARRRALDLARRSGQAIEVPMDVELPEEMPSLETRLQRKADDAALWSAVNGLEPGQRQVMQLYYREGRTVAEVARRLDLTEPTVRQRLSRGRRRLRASLVDDLRVHRSATLVLATLGTAWLGRAAAAASLGVMVGVVGLATMTVQRVEASLPPDSGVTRAASRDEPSPSPELPPGSPPSATSRTDLYQAIMAAEDARFEEHGGVDGWAVMRATWHNVRGEPIQGGSTITQQLAKNMLAPRTEPSLERKLAETLLAWQLEAELDKQTILDRYLDAVYFGAGARGVDEAARTYFDADVDALTLGQVALLAALPAAPSATNPLRHPETARLRRDWVLDQMVENGWADRDEATRAAQEPLPRAPGASIPR